MSIENELPPETEGEKALRLLEEHGLLGCMEGDGYLSENYKKHLWQAFYDETNFIEKPEIKD